MVECSITNIKVRLQVVCSGETGMNIQLSDSLNGLSRWPLKIVSSSARYNQRYAKVWKLEPFSD